MQQLSKLTFTSRLNLLVSSFAFCWFASRERSRSNSLTARPFRFGRVGIGGDSLPPRLGPCHPQHDPSLGRESTRPRRPKARPRSPDAVSGSGETVFILASNLVVLGMNLPVDAILPSALPSHPLVRPSAVRALSGVKSFRVNDLLVLEAVAVFLRRCDPCSAGAPPFLLHLPPPHNPTRAALHNYHDRQLGPRFSSQQFDLHTAGSYQDELAAFFGRLASAGVFLFYESFLVCCTMTEA